MINAYARSDGPWGGWLFDDFKRGFEVEGERMGIEVVASDTPLPDADAWICIRTREASACPDPSRCVVQVHDFREHVWRGAPFGAVSYVHPDCRVEFPEAHLEITCAGDSWARYINPLPRSLCRPIGSRRLFTLRDSMPERFTVGWVGRDVVHEGRHIKRPQLFVDAVKAARAAGVEVRAIMYGPRLEKYISKPVGYAHPDDGICGFYSDRAESLRDFYHSIDVLVVTCEPEPGPLSIYEALACGVPVISTETGALDTNDIGYTWAIRCSPEHLRGVITAAADNRRDTFDHRAEIRESVTHWQDGPGGWLEDNINLAMEVAR